MSFIDNLTKTPNHEDMELEIASLLKPGEGVAASVYCVFKNQGILNVPGYGAVTGSGRFLGVKLSVTGTTRFSADLNNLESIKLSGALLGQRSVSMKFRDGTPDISFQFSSKLVGSKFPEQPENCARLEKELRSRSEEGK